MLRLFFIDLYLCPRFLGTFFCGNLLFINNQETAGDRSNFINGLSDQVQNIPTKNEHMEAGGRIFFENSPEIL